MFERFTEQARRAIFFARYEASMYGSPYIETEHFLLGLLREDPKVTSLLPGMPSPDALRREIEKHIESRERIPTSVEIPLTAQCKRILNFAADEAQRLGPYHVGTEHLLLGIFREKHCLAATILHADKIDLNKVHERIRGSRTRCTPQRPRSNCPNLRKRSRPWTPFWPEFATAR
jgi:ATP-dependent Clp protease ATP-binding subunit ClpC